MALLKSVVRGTRRSARSGVWFMLGFLAFGLCLILALYLQNADTRAALSSDSNNLPLLLGVIPAVLLLIALGLFVTNRQVNKLLEPKLQAVEGAVSFDTGYSSGSGATSYYADVGDERFAFAEDMSGVFEDGARYRVYFFNSGPYQFIFSYEKVA